ncbi:MAG: hypothetical protein ACK4NX_00885, partial [Candidatus Paceibacteria bacterium]
MFLLIFGAFILGSALTFFFVSGFGEKVSTIFNTTKNFLTKEPLVGIRTETAKIFQESPGFSPQSSPASKSRKKPAAILEEKVALNQLNYRASIPSSIMQSPNIQ